MQLLLHSEPLVWAPLAPKVVWFGAGDETIRPGAELGCKTLLGAGTESRADLRASLWGELSYEAVLLIRDFRCRLEVSESCSSDETATGLQQAGQSINQAQTHYGMQC